MTLFRLASFLTLAACGSGDTPVTDSALLVPAARPPAAASAPDSATSPRAPSRWVITPRGFGPVLAGMSVSELSRALAERISPKVTACDYVRPAALPQDVLVMVERDTVARIDVRAKGVLTAEGAGVGDTEASVLERYKGRIRTTPHKYTDGHYLTVSAPPDSTHLIVFETDGRLVVQYRAGRRPAVEYVEGCS